MDIVTQLTQQLLPTKPGAGYIEEDMVQWYEDTMTHLDNLHIQGVITPQEFGQLETILFE